MHLPAGALCSFEGLRIPEPCSKARCVIWQQLLGLTPYEEKLQHGKFSKRACSKRECK